MPGLHALATEVVAGHGELLVDAGLTEERALDTLRGAAPGLARWMNRYLRPDPDPDGLLSAGYDAAAKRECRKQLAVKVPV